jgi:hypothetical protein
MRQGSVRVHYQFERCPRLSQSLTSTVSALRRFYAVLIHSEGVRVFNGFRSRRKLQRAIG